MSSFLFNFAIEDVLSSALKDFQHVGLELLPGECASDLDYADDIALVGDDPQSTQLILDRLAVEASKYGMSFAPVKSTAQSLAFTCSRAHSQMWTT
ncbi:unnamed protein product [Dicrocoelium dendriticum]|nr:unnamed protein product [Dicrocoelium dendriticum]